MTRDIKTWHELFICSKQRNIEFNQTVVNFKINNIGNYEKYLIIKQTKLFMGFLY